MRGSRDRHAHRLRLDSVEHLNIILISSGVITGSDLLRNAGIIIAYSHQFYPGQIAVYTRVIPPHRSDPYYSDSHALLLLIYLLRRLFLFYLGSIEFNRHLALAVQQLKQDSHSLATRNARIENCLITSKWTFLDQHRIAVAQTGEQFTTHCCNFIYPFFDSGNQILRYHRRLVTETDQSHGMGHPL